MLASHVLPLPQKGPSAARKVENELMDSIRSLYQMSENYPVVKYRKMFVEKLQLILNQIKNQTVYVDLMPIAGRITGG